MSHIVAANRVVVPSLFFLGGGALSIHSDYTGTIYSDCQGLNLMIRQVTDRACYSAQWGRGKYSVRFHAAPGECAISLVMFDFPLLLLLLSVV